MKLIDTSGLVTGTKGMPIEGNAGGYSIYSGGTENVVQGIDFIFASILEGDAQLACALLTVAQQLGNTPVILWGCVKSGNQISSGAIYVPSGALGVGEIFICRGTGAYGGISGTPNTYISCSWTAAPTDTSPQPQTELSDGSLVSINNQRLLTFAYSATPNAGNILDFGQWQQSAIAQMLTTPVPVLVGSVGNPAYGSGFSQLDALYFYKKYNNEVTIWGDCTKSSLTGGTIFTLPYTPAGSRKIGFIMGLGNTVGDSFFGTVSVDASGNVIIANVTNVVYTASTSINWFIGNLTFVVGQ